MELIDRLLFSNEKFTNQLTAVILLSTTAIFMQNIVTELQNKKAKGLKNLFESIIMRDRKTTEYWEKIMDDSEEARRYQNKIRNSWQTLLENDFSYPSIHAYLVSQL